MAVPPSGFGGFQFGNSPFGGQTSETSTSGTYSWNPPISEIVLDAYERCGKTGVELTSQLIQSARRSLNFVLSSWTNFGPNLWQVEEVVQFMPQGVATYFDDASCVDILPDSVFIRQYQMGAPASSTPNFTTTAGSQTVTIGGLSATPLVGGYLSIVIPVSIGGIILQGFYPVVSVPGQEQATITAPSVATSSVTSGGVVPSFSTAAGITTVAVNFPNHGLADGQTFVVQEDTSVGGIVLFGPYTVGTAASNSFTITAASPAGFNDTQSENGGQALLAVSAIVSGMTQNAAPVDIMLFSLSRGDFQAIPAKTIQGRPTSFWINKQIVPILNFWPVPDANGPYELHYWRHRQVQDADIAGGQTIEIPYAFQEAFVSSLAANLAVKWAPERAKDLMLYAQERFTEAADNNRERVSTFVVPDVSGYFG